MKWFALGLMLVACSTIPAGIDKLGRGCNAQAIAFFHMWPGNTPLSQLPDWQCAAD
jgi:hypothetical protein